MWLPMLLVSCARLPPDWVWDEVAACAMPAEERAACLARPGASVGRPLECTGVDLPPVPAQEVRRQEAAYRKGELACVCITEADWQRCVETP